MKRSTALTENLHDEAAGHLLRADRQEDLCFGLWVPSGGSTRETAIVNELLLPRPNERNVHGNVSFTPLYFERAIKQARASDRGIVLMHSHLGPGWQGMSEDDVAAERGHAAPILAATGLPFLGMTLGTDGAWSARLWVKRDGQFIREWCESVRVVGDKLRLTFCDHLLRRPQFDSRLLRTLAAWGDTEQAHLARLRIGIIGCGSVGSIIAETLVRMGITNLTLIDYDRIKIHNLDRTLHATRRDARTARRKVSVIANGIRRSATVDGFKVDALDLSVVEEQGFRHALDCDVLFSCVDRPWPRFVLNFAAYAHLIPVIDGGIRLQAMSDGSGLKRATWKAHVATAGHRCLECLRQYEPSDVSLQRAGLLDDATYIEGLDRNHHLRSSENVFAFSLGTATREILQFLRMCVKHPGHSYLGAETEHFVSGLVDRDIRGCEETCPFPQMLAKGDRTEFTTITGHDSAAHLPVPARPAEMLRFLVGMLIGGVLLIRNMVRRGLRRKST